MQWLSAIARNVSLRWTRRHGREHARHVHLRDDGDEAAPSTEEGLADEFDLEVELERGELAELLDRASGVASSGRKEPDAT